MTMHQAMNIVQAFSHSQYLIRRKVFTFAGAKFHVYDPAGNVVLFAKMKAFKLKEDLRLFTGEDMTTELLSIKARSIIDFSAAYDIFDSENGEKLGAVKRRGLKSSFLRDEWVIVDPAEREIGMMQEDSTGLALLRRYVDLMALILPQKYNVTVRGGAAATFQQSMNPFVQKMTVTFPQGGEPLIDRRFALAASIILMAIEGKQRGG